MKLIKFLKVTELVSGTARFKSKFHFKTHASITPLHCLINAISLKQTSHPHCTIARTINLESTNLRWIWIPTYISHVTLGKPSVALVLFCKNKIKNIWQLDPHVDGWWTDSSNRSIGILTIVGKFHLLNKIHWI